MVESIRSGVVKAKKDYECDLCFLKILKGTKHQFNVGVDDGTATTWRYHEICLSKTNDWDGDDWENPVLGQAFRFQYGITQEIIDGGQWTPQTDNPTLLKAEV